MGDVTAVDALVFLSESRGLSWESGLSEQEIIAEFEYVVDASLFGLLLFVRQINHMGRAREPSIGTSVVSTRYAFASCSVDMSCMLMVAMCCCSSGAGTWHRLLLVLLSWYVLLHHTKCIKTMLCLLQYQVIDGTSHHQIDFSYHTWFMRYAYLVLLIVEVSSYIVWKKTILSCEIEDFVETPIASITCNTCNTSIPRDTAST